MSKNSVDNPCIAYEQMALKWTLLHDLLGGTNTMRSAGMRWLPMEESETEVDYERRLSRSFLHGMYKDAIEKLSAKPFAEPITIQGLSDSLDYLLYDCDGADTTIHQLAYDLMYDLLVYGKTHIIVDFTVNKEADTSTIADEKELKARAYMTRISPSDLIGWRRNEATGKLIRIRIKEQRIEPDENYTEQIVNYVRVYTEDTWELYMEVDGDKGKYYLRTEEGIFNHPDGITLVTIYANRTGFLTADPTLEELAWTNLAHWQSYSDQRNILSFSRFGMIFMKGVTKTDAKTGIIVGPRRSIITDSDNADAKYLEPTGKGIEAGERDLEQLEMKGEILGNIPLSKKTSKTTATAKVIDTDRTESPMQRYVRNLEDGLELAFYYAAGWHKVKLPKDFKVQIYSDFSLGIYADTDATMLLKMRQAKELSYKTYINELQRRGRLSEDIDPEEELERISLEEPNMADLLASEEDDDDYLENGGES